MAEYNARVIEAQETSYLHAHDWLGRPVNCCGCWTIRREKSGRVYLRCNECGEQRTITGSPPPSLSGIAAWSGLRKIIGDDFDPRLKVVR